MNKEIVERQVERLAQGKHNGLLGLAQGRVQRTRPMGAIMQSSRLSHFAAVARVMLKTLATSRSDRLDSFSWRILGIMRAYGWMRVTMCLSCSGCAHHDTELFGGASN
jgi:hypothetical protein